MRKFTLGLILAIGAIILTSCGTKSQYDLQAQTNFFAINVTTISDSYSKNRNDKPKMKGM